MHTMPYSVTPSSHALRSTQTMRLDISRLLYVICNSIRPPMHVLGLAGHFFISVDLATHQSLRLKQPERMYMIVMDIPDISTL